MNTLLFEPVDLLFFRDAIPMSAGQGKGTGCQMPFPSTVHEALRSSLLLATGNATPGKCVEGRPQSAPRTGNWHEQRWPEAERRFIANRAFRSLRSVGPLPFLREPFVWIEMRQGLATGVEVSYRGLLVPVPLDVALERAPDQNEFEPPRFLRRLKLVRSSPMVGDVPHSPEAFRPFVLPAATTAPDKLGQLSGWWTIEQYQAYLELGQDERTRTDNTNHFFHPLPTDELWQPEHRVGVEVEVESFTAKHGQLYAGSYLRTHSHTSFALQTQVEKPVNGEDHELRSLNWLLLGGERRLARLWHNDATGRPLPDIFANLKKTPPFPKAAGPCLLKWVLATPAIFMHGSLPGWCAFPDGNQDGRPLGEVRLGRSQRKLNSEDLPGRAFLISWCLGKPLTVSGWDLQANKGRGAAKPTQLAVPAGSVYYFLCETQDTAAALCRKLHWQPRSDFYGEKGCGYGLVSFDVQMHRTSPDVRTIAQELFER